MAGRGVTAREVAGKKETEEWIMKITSEQRKKKQAILSRVHII